MGADENNDLFNPDSVGVIKKEKPFPFHALITKMYKERFIRFSDISVNRAEPSLISF